MDVLWDKELGCLKYKQDDSPLQLTLTGCFGNDVTNWHLWFIRKVIKEI